MKIYRLIVVLIILSPACKQQQQYSAAESKIIAADTANYTTIQWMDTLKDAGVLTFGEKANIKFSFKNTGDKPLMIINAQPGCGCTVADYPKEAIAPGAEGVIVAGFDTKKGSIGAFSKSISVTTNTKGSTNTNLTFKGQIKNEEKS